MLHPLLRFAARRPLQAHNRRDKWHVPKWASGDQAQLKAHAVAINASLVECQTADCVLRYADHMHDAGDAVNAATAMHRLAKVRSTLVDRGDARLAKLAAFATECAPRLSSQGLANVAWAAAKVGGAAAPRGLFDAVALEAPKKIERFNAQALANIIWSFARAEVEAPTLFEAAAAEACNKMPSFGSQALANTVWAYATAGFEAPALFEAVAFEVAFGV
ncbi:hypothetical protein M885DRAFT_465476, partial [Pelagophyceae sp. CCMP2097]